ncbi:MAG: hypothetical protein ACOX61_03755 [Brooklawnia sp.]
MTVEFTPQEVDVHPLRILPVSLALLLATGLSGCGPDSDINAPPSPVTASSPGPVRSTPTPTPDKEALYEEAEQIFLRSMELRSAYEHRGDFSEFPPELELLLADPHLNNMRAAYVALQETQWRAPEGSYPAIDTAPLPNAVRDGSLVALQACIDTREVPALDPEGNVVSPGRLLYAHLFFKEFDGDLKLFIADGRGSVEECPFK